jgi:hypothetical protein
VTGEPLAPVPLFVLVGRDLPFPRHEVAELLRWRRAGGRVLAGEQRPVPVEDSGVDGLPARVVEDRVVVGDRPLEHLVGTPVREHPQQRRPGEVERPGPLRLP